MVWLFIFTVFFCSCHPINASAKEALIDLSQHEPTLKDQTRRLYEKGGRSYLENGHLDPSLMNDLCNTLHTAIHCQRSILILKNENPLSSIKQETYERLKARRLELQAQNKDLFNEDLSALEKLQRKLDQSKHYKDDLAFLEQLTQIDQKLEKAKCTHSGDEAESFDVSQLIQERQQLYKKLTPRGQYLFHLHTSLGYVKGYLDADLWRHSEDVLHTITTYITKETSKVMGQIFITVPHDIIQTHILGMMENILQGEASLVDAIHRFIKCSDVPYVMTMFLSKRPDLLAAYSMEDGRDEHPMHRRIFALAMLDKIIRSPESFEGTALDLEKEIRSREQIIALQTEHYVEEINRRALGPAPHFNNHPLEGDDDHDNDRLEAVLDHDQERDEVDENSEDGEAENSPRLNPTDDDNNQGSPSLSSVSEADGDGLNSDDEEAAALNAQGTLIDPEAFFKTFQTVEHLKAFLNIKVLQLHKDILNTFLESARSEKLRMLSSSGDWKARLWHLALRKGMLTMMHIKPVIQALQEQAILEVD